MPRIGLIRVLTTEDAQLLQTHGRLIMERFPSLQVTSRCIPDHPSGVHNEATERSAAPLVAALAAEFEKEGYDAVIVSCAGDPGVEEARRQVRIPVIGAGRACAAVARGLGDKLGAMGITPDIPEAMRAVLGDALVAYVQPPGVHTTLDLMTHAGAAALDEAAQELKARGIDAVALACTGMSTIGAARRIAKTTGLMVVDPVMSEALLALEAVQLAAWTRN